QVRTQADVDIGFSMKIICRKYFGINLDYVGYLEYDATVWQSVKKRRPLLMEFPNSALVANFDRIVHRLLNIRSPGLGRIMEPSSKNYYEVLEVPTDATSDDIHKGYIRAKNAYSQASLALYSLMTKDECDQILDLIDEAYTILSDPDIRRLYDEARGINQNLNYK